MHPLHRHAAPYIAALAGLLALATALLAGCHISLPRPDASVTVEYAGPTITSRFAAGLTYVDSSLDPTGTSDPQSLQRARSLIHKEFSFENTYIMAWGMPDPWPDPAQPAPTDWQSLDARLHAIVGTGGTPVISLSEAPWWMKGQLQANGTTTLLTADDEWGNIAYSSRVLDNKMSDWLLLVRSVAARYMVPPYNVRYFQVWNELKGYYDPRTNQYDYSDSPGDPSGPNAEHGYTHMYNLVYQAIMQVASKLGISSSEIEIGGPYVPMDTWSSPQQNTDSSLTTAYGTYDQRPFDVVEYWLQHKAGAGFITVDASNKNDDLTEITDPFTAAEKFSDVVRWIRSLDGTVYPGSTTLPIWLAEWYAIPFSNPQNVAINAAVKAYAMASFALAGGSVAFSWGWQGDSSSQAGLWTPLEAGGGQPLLWYDVYSAFQRDFSAGTTLYPVEISTPNNVAAIATRNVTMLINKTSRSIIVSVSGVLVSLAPYGVSLVNNKTQTRSPIT
jgi:hypothetical protein